MSKFHKAMGILALIASLVASVADSLKEEPPMPVPPAS